MKKKEQILMLKAQLAQMEHEYQGHISRLVAQRDEFANEVKALMPKPKPTPHEHKYEAHICSANGVLSRAENVARLDIYCPDCNIDRTVWDAKLEKICSIPPQDRITHDEVEHLLKCY